MQIALKKQKNSFSVSRKIKLQFLSIFCFFLSSALGCGETSPQALPRYSNDSLNDASLQAVVLSNDASLDANENDASIDAPIDAESKSEHCASSFGNRLTAPYGRLDGTVSAILNPSVPKDMACPRPNSDHVILQVDAGGEIYRMVINVKSTRGTEDRVYFLKRSAQSRRPEWEEGWHTTFTFSNTGEDAGESIFPLELDYPNDLGAHASEFVPKNMAELSNEIQNSINIGDLVSVYASTSGGDSAHLIHRNTDHHDGAIAVMVARHFATWYLFRFAEQEF